MTRVVMQWRFRVHYQHGASQTWRTGQWCEWTDLPDAYTFDLPAGAQLQFRRKPRRGEVSPFCPCGFMDSGSCGPKGCPRAMARPALSRPA